MSSGVNRKRKRQSSSALIDNGVDQGLEGGAGLKNGVSVLSPSGCSYADPDYQDSHNNVMFPPAGSSGAQQSSLISPTCKFSPAQVEDKILRVLDREFTSLIREKESQLSEIDEKIFFIQKSLHLVRYASVNSFYAPAMPKPSKSSGVTIHPATRKLLGGKAPKQVIKPEPQPTTSTKISVTPEKPKPPSVTPEYVPPKNLDKDVSVAKEPRDSRFKYKRRFIIGNVSKWIQCDEREDRSTHKWMIYVRGDKNQPDVSDVVEKVRFLIHPSYHPHDLIEVKDPPFHLTRRGWGEFPARIQINFKHNLDKPLDVIHNLKLDRTYTGLQTLGSETVVDIWLHNPTFHELPKTKKIKKEIEPDDGGFVISHSSDKNLRPPKKNNEIITENSAENNNKTKTPEIAGGQKSLLKTSPETEKSPQTTYIRCTDKDGKVYYLPVTLLPNNQQKQVTSPIKQQQPQRVKPQLVKPPLISKSISSGASGFNVTSRTEKVTSVGQKVIRLSDGQYTVIHSPDKPSTSTAVKPPTAGGVSLLSGKKVAPGMSLLRKQPPKPLPQPVVVPQASKIILPEVASISSTTVITNSNNGTAGLSDLEKSVPNISIETWKEILGRSNEETQLEIENRVSKKGVHLLKKQTNYFQFLSQKVLNLKVSDFPSLERCSAYMAKFLPLVTPAASDPLYRALHPYSASSEKEYRSWNLGKQLASEWLRAKTIRRIINYLDKDANITTKIIWRHLRDTGYAISLPKPSHLSSNELQTVNSTDHSRFNSYTSMKIDIDLSSDNTPISPSVDTVSKKEAEIVDIESIDEPPSKKKKEIASTLPIDESSSVQVKKVIPAPSRTHLLFPEDKEESFKYVGEQAKNLGIQFVQEDIVNKIYYPAAQKVVYRACKNLCENIIRLSYKESRTRNPTEENPTVEIFDVRRAVMKDPLLAILTNQGLGINPND